MPVLILVNKSSLVLHRVDDVMRGVVKLGDSFQVAVERRAGYQAAFIKVIQLGKSYKAQRVTLEKSHNVCAMEWIMMHGTVVHVAWLPERATRSRYVPVLNSGDHVCTLECECAPAGQMDSESIQTYAPFPGMPNSKGHHGWADRWQALRLTPELLAAKKVIKAKHVALNEEYDVMPSDVERVLLSVQN